MYLLDLTLPDGSGYSVCKRIKEIGDFPVIFLTAYDDEVNVVMGFELGADDYITKPFELPELLARVKVQLRKGGSAAHSNTICFNEITLHPDTLTVELNGTEIRLTRTECAVLKLLMNNPNIPVSRSSILDKINLDTPDCTERSLKQHISNIRRKLQAVSGKDYIEAVYGIGFKMRS